VLVGKPLIFLTLIPRIGYSTRTAFLTGCTMAQISEFSFIIAGVGVAQGLISSKILSIIALVGLLSISVSAYMIDAKLRLYALFDQLKISQWGIFRSSGKAERRATRDHHIRQSRHIIVVGMNTLGRQLVNELHKRGEEVLAVDTDPVKLKGLPGESLLGSVDYLSVLQEAGLERAKLLVSALRIEDTNDLLAYRCQMAGVPSAIHVVDLSVVDNLLELGADYLMIPKVDGVKAQVKKLKELGILKS